MRFVIPVLLVVLAGSVAAQPPPGPDAHAAAMARSLFHEGVELADAHQWSEAADRFRRAQAMRPSPIIAFNLSVAVLEAGIEHESLVEAVEMLEWVRRHAETPEAMAADATARLELNRPRLASVRLSIEGSLDGVTLSIDDRPVPHGAVGAWIPVNPSEHTVVAMRGEERFSAAVPLLEEGTEYEVALTIPAFVPEVVEPEVVVDPAEDARRALEAQRRHNLLMADQRQQEQTSRRQRRRRRAIGITVALLVAGAAATTAVVLTRDDPHPNGTLQTVDWR